MLVVRYSIRSKQSIQFKRAARPPLEGEQTLVWLREQGGYTGSKSLSQNWKMGCCSGKGQVEELGKPEEKEHLLHVPEPTGPSTANNFCYKCGCRLRSGAVFCSGCGVKVVSPSSSPSPRKRGSSPRPSSSSQKETWREKEERLRKENEERRARERATSEKALNETVKTLPHTTVTKVPTDKAARAGLSILGESET